MRDDKRMNEIIEDGQISVADEDIDKVNHEILKVQDAEELVINEDIKEIKKYIKRRKNLLAKTFEERINEISLNQDFGIAFFDISKLAFQPLLKPSRCIKKYSEVQLLLVLDYYQEQLIEINKRVKMPPLLEQYCRLLGISTNLFKRDYLNSDNEELRNAAQQVVDYISGCLSFAGMTEKVNATSQIFVQKSSLNRVEKGESENKKTNNVLIVSSDDFAKDVNKIISNINK